MTTRTYTPRQSEIERRWFVVDASGQTLGRLATQVAGLLAGKHKPIFTTNLDTGDHVIVINAARVAVKGDKLSAKVYARHSGYPGGFRSETLGELLERRPEEVVRRAVRGMLPRNRLGAQQLRKLKVYAEAEHPHEAQQPAVVADASDALAAAAVAVRAAPAAKPEKIKKAPEPVAVAEPVADTTPEPVADTVAEPVAAAVPAADEAGEPSAEEPASGELTTAADTDAGASATDEGESRA
jgi:large subunit ribosomal protein L13